MVWMMLLTACNKKLEEHPYTVFTTEYFKTPAGLQSAVNALYSDMRYNFGPNGALAVAVVGTDEFTYGDQPRTGPDGDNTSTRAMGDYTLSSSTGPLLTPWNRNFSMINLANGVVEYAETIEMDETSKNVMVGEARFLRSLYYMLLVQQFGAVPLDLGSGELKLNTKPFTGFNRQNREELLVKNYQSIIDDLVFAAANLPDQRPGDAFKLSKAAAMHMLARAYIHRGYSAAKQGTDFRNAYDVAKQLIDNRATYGTDLLQDYGDVHRQGNDYNMEVLYSVERLPNDYNSNEVPDPNNDFSAKVNIANNMFNCNYQQVQVGGKNVFKDRPIQYGRPLRRYAPTKWLLETAFKDRYNDSRFDNSFRMLWRCATLDAPGTAGYDTYVADMASVGLSIGDTAFFLAPTNAYADSMNALGKRYRVFAPREFYSNQNVAWNIYPNLKKYDDSVRTGFNYVSGRPFIVSKLSEVYLLAAEAALQDGRPDDAVPLINTLRERAAYRPGLSADQLAARRAAMRIGVANITLDFILDERTRELCGESMRWPDLAVRGKLLERVKAYNPDGAGNIQDFHVLRPIPQSQFDNVTDPDKAQYQNPGYN